MKSLIFGIYIPNIWYLTWNITILKFISLRNPSVSCLSWSRKINLRIHVIFSIRFSFKRRASKSQSFFSEHGKHRSTRIFIQIFISDSFLRKNFFALTLHPYIATLCILLYINNLQRFQIFSNPTLNLHQPYTNHACQGMKLIINNEWWIMWIVSFAFKSNLLIIN